MTTLHPPHLFLVEDDPALREMLAAYLIRQGLGVTTQPSAEGFFAAFALQRPDVLILDVGLPGMDGLEVCRLLRARADRLPIILLTARSEEVDRVLGLEMGADDYLSKPFSARELVARVRAIMRRAQGVLHEAATPAGTVRIGEHAFSLETRSLVKGNAFKVLNPVEFALLAELVSNANVPVDRNRLAEVSHADNREVMPRAVDVAIMRLRKLIEPFPAQPRYIRTIRGQGYVFVPQGA